MGVASQPRSFVCAPTITGVIVRARHAMAARRQPCGLPESLLFIRSLLIEERLSCGIESRTLSPVIVSGRKTQRLSQAQPGELTASLFTIENPPLDWIRCRCTLLSCH